MVAQEVFCCKVCSFVCFWLVDFKGHLKYHAGAWRRSRKGGWWMPKDHDPFLRDRLKMRGGFVEDGWRYALVKDKVIWRGCVKKQGY